MGGEPDGRPPRLARPYTLVGGRTRGALTALALETLVWTIDAGARAGAPDDPIKARLMDHCRESAQSLAELSALLDTPIGVTRVLVGDLVADGLLEVGETASAEGGAMDDVDLLKRVLANVERL